MGFADTSLEVVEVLSYGPYRLVSLVNLSLSLQENVASDMVQLVIAGSAAAHVL